MTEHLSSERSQQPLHSDEQAHTLKSVLLPWPRPSKDDSSASETLAVLKPQTRLLRRLYTNGCGHHRRIVTVYTTFWSRLGGCVPHMHSRSASPGRQREQVCAVRWRNLHDADPPVLGRYNFNLTISSRTLSILLYTRSSHYSWFLSLSYFLDFLKSISINTAQHKDLKYRFIISGLLKKPWSSL